MKLKLMLFSTLLSFSLFGQSQKNDWKIIPGVRVGPITTKTTVKDLENIFGFTNVIRESVNISPIDASEENYEYAIAAYVFKGTKNEIMVFWNDSYTKVSNVEFHEKNSNWHLEGGLKVGSTINELKAYNQGEFYFYKFGWDFGGYIVSDGLQGKMKQYIDVLNIRLDGYDKTVNQRFSGDGETVSSNAENLFQMTDARITSISITLKENYIPPKLVSNAINYFDYSIFGKVVTIDKQGSMFRTVTIKVEPNKYFQYYRDYDEGLRAYCKKKITKPMNFDFSIALSNCTNPTKFYKSNQKITIGEFFDLAKTGKIIGIKFENGLLKTKSDGYTLQDQSDGILIATRIDIL